MSAVNSMNSMNSVNSLNSSLELNPLLTPEDLKPAVTAPKPGLLKELDIRLRARIDGWKARNWNDPSRRGRTIRIGAIVLVVLLAGAGGAYWKWGIVHQPNYATDDLDDVLGFSFLTDDFNKLPIDERLRLLSELIERMKSSSAEDSAMLAAFMAGIAGQAREQLMENSSKIAIDMFDQYARKYDEVPPEEREKFIDDSFVDMAKKMEAMAGVTRDISDEDRIKEMTRQVGRDKQRIESGKGPGGAIAGRLFDFVQNNVASKASPQQRGQGATLMRDMGRRFRGEDIKKGR